MLHTVHHTDRLGAASAAALGDYRKPASTAALGDRGRATAALGDYR